MKRVNAKEVEPTRRAGWLLGPVVVSYCPDESDDEALAQARDLAIAAVVDVKSFTMNGAVCGGVADVAAASGAGLVVLPSSLIATAQGWHRLREAVATARPVLVARPRLAGPVMVVADAPRAGLGTMAIAADEARRLDRLLLVIHAAEGKGGPAGDELGSVSTMTLRACLKTIRLRCGVAVETRSIEGPCVSSLSSLARAVAARLIVLGAYEGSGTDNAIRTQRMLEIASEAPCSVLLLPPPPAENQWFAEQPNQKRRFLEETNDT